jgi:uncharacterized protein
LGLEPLARRILEQPELADPRSEAAAFTDAGRGVASAEEALQGARDIVAEVLAETAAIRGFARELYRNEGALVVKKRAEVQGPTKFEAYYDFREPCKTIPSHRFLAVRRGENENVLLAAIEADTDRALGEISRLAGRNGASPFAPELDAAIADAWKRLIAPSIEAETRAELKMRADEKAVEVFAQNLGALLLAPPLGPQVVVGIDPGQRTGCKVAVVDRTGKLLHHTTLFLVQGEEALARSRETLREVADRFRPAAVAIGNGTHGRETESFARETLAGSPEVLVVMVNEAGASVYSASEVARKEHPDLDVTIRGAISIARRLQDPLAELVKIEPKSIGVGQYQHDVHQPLLTRKLDDVVESCVNQVGVELNTASPSLLSYVAGIGPSIAQRVVAHRDAHGAFRSRRALLEVPGVGPKTFEQAAGFLRIRDGDDPLDSSAVHPERYPVVERMARDLGVEVAALVGNAALAARIEWQRYVALDLGEPTLRDILQELGKPGRDPRASFEPPRFREDVRTLEDLRSGMELEGVVTNVTAFGAFVDVGVHQDGLVHLSQLADRFVKEPSDVVRPGDRIKVRVLEVDLARRRVSLTAKSPAPPPAPRPPKAEASPAPKRPAGNRSAPSSPKQAPQKSTFRNNPFATLLKR